MPTVSSSTPAAGVCEHRDPDGEGWATTRVHRTPTLPFTADLRELPDIAVVRTLLGGVTVHSA